MRFDTLLHESRHAQTDWMWITVTPCAIAFLEYRSWVLRNPAFSNSKKKHVGYLTWGCNNAIISSDILEKTSMSIVSVL